MLVRIPDSQPLPMGRRVNRPSFVADQSGEVVRTRQRPRKAGPAPGRLAGEATERAITGRSQARDRSRVMMPARHESLQRRA